MALYLFIGFVFLLFSVKWPDFMFWLAVLIYLDPGGYIQTFIPREMIGGLQRTDLTFPLLFIPLISKKVNVNLFFRSNLNVWIVSFLFLFTLFYHILVFGIIAPNNAGSALEVIQYQRLTLIGFLSIIPGYIFFLRSYRMLFNFAIISSIILMSLYIITLFFNIRILPLLEFERTTGSGIMRIAVLSYGFAQWFIYFAVIMIIAKLNLPFRSAILILAIVVIGAELITLTRRIYFVHTFQLIFVVWIFQKFKNRTLLNKSLIRIAIFILIGFLLLVSIFPVNFRNIATGFNDTFSLITIGKDTQGQEDGRLSSDIPQHLARFKKSPLIGYGWDKNWYSNQSEEGGLSANDSPLTAAIGMFGILGLAIYSIYYFKLFKILKSTHLILKEYYKTGFYKNKQLLFAFCIYLFTTTTSYFIIGFMGLFVDLVVGYSRSTTMLSIGFLLAGRQLMLNDLQSNSLFSTTGNI
jgi:hypothetical protein